MKEIKVTESFLGLDNDIKQCQTKDSYLDCTSKHYMERVTQDCGCVPLSLMISKEVLVLFFVNLSDFFIFASLVPIFQAPICTAGQLKCLKNITVNNSLCLNNCKGMMITSFYKDYHTKDLNLNPFISELIQDYNNYKKDFQFPHGIRGNMKLNPCNINRDFLQSIVGKTN